MVLETAFPPDIRLEKEMRALKTQGHEVILLCRHVDDQPIEERFEDATVVRFREPSEGNALSKKFAVLRQWLTARKQAWEIALTEFVKEKNIQALHVHDLPLVPTALAVARKQEIPLVFDMHEIYPVMVRDRTGVPSGLINRINTGIHSLLFSPRWWDRVEQCAVRDADRIIVVVDESKQRLVKMGISADKISVVLNAEDIDKFANLPGAESLDLQFQNDFVVGYVGGVDSPNRGLENLVKAWPLVLPKIPNARLLIVGDGGMRPVIETLVHSLDLTERVTFTGWVTFQEVAAYIDALNLAVIPHVINEHTNHTIPHKLFQYIALGKMIVASDIVPIRRIIEDTHAGIIAREWSPQGFADAIVRAHALLQAGQHDAGRQVEVLKKRYGFKAMAQPLLELYESLERSR